MPPRLTVREVIQKLQADGWALVGQKGSHRHFKHPSKSGKVTVAGALGEIVPAGTLVSIERQAGWR